MSEDYKQIVDLAVKEGLVVKVRFGVERYAIHPPSAMGARPDIQIWPSDCAVMPITELGDIFVELFADQLPAAS